MREECWIKKTYVDDNSDTPRSLLLSVIYRHSEANSWFLKLSAENALKRQSFQIKPISVFRYDGNLVSKIL